MKFELAYGITINVSKEDENGFRTGSITSQLKEEVNLIDLEYDAAISGLESLLLALACNGIDMNSKAVSLSIEDAVTAITNKYGD